MGNAGRKKTVAFYEIVRPKESGDPRFEHLDWPRVLRNLGIIEMRQRRYKHGADVYVGDPISVQGRQHLVLARLRDGDIQQIDWEHSHISDLRLDGDRSVVDTTIICFLPFGNVIGVIQGSASAPRPTALQRWLNAMNVVNEDLAVMPLVGKKAWEKLSNAEAVNLFEMRLRPGQMMFPSDAEGLGDFSRQAHKRNPDALITLSMKIPKRRGFGRDTSRSRGERRLREDVQHFISDFGSLVGPGGAVDRAIAHVTLSASDGSLIEDQINFVSDHITAQKPVFLRRSEGQAPWYEAAVHAVLDVAAAHEAELRDAVRPVP
ncbi:hypothetical protein [Streptomyces marianii]|uniref:Uncharacterized protein n=1 Tax=Streptomyces marianii TaxID=1817406 RepID=A0A5R9E3A5_9ACTN|nr:hypothetical protein [Streptomyces marianii]TLQ43422.1 hypothetical protein FEF34_09955 [Streptomyces marianii]